MIYAEVIGDPVAQSKSPAIHGFWLKALGIEGDFRATRVVPEDLAGYFESRRTDPDWRGCNVTTPLKADVIPFLDKIDPAAERIGAVNCITPQDGALVGTNTDVDGIGEALAEAPEGKTVLIGAGGAARAGAAWLGSGKSRPVVILARNPAKAIALMGLSGPETTVASLDQAEVAIAGADLLINASTLGMIGADPMPREVLAALATAEADATAFDMVTAPARTPFLDAAETAGLRTVGGLAMLVGQARGAFELFFGATPPPERDADLRHLLSGN